MSQANHVITNFKENWSNKLILSNPLDQNTAKQLKLSNSFCENDTEHYFTKQWFCGIDIGEWEEVEIFIGGNSEKPDEEFVEMADQILKQFHMHLRRALDYLKELMPGQESKGYYLSTVTFGRILNFDEYLLSGFTLAFVYGDYPDAFQYKVKFKNDGWPIGFEGGPL